jgi:hypothetical protein
MKKLKLEGFYNYVNAPSGKGVLTGELDLTEDNSFRGKIRDHASRAPIQIIQGHLYSENNLDRLIFLKFPPKTNLANLIYYLEKKSEDSFEGKYMGRWAALPYKIEYNANYDLITAMVDVGLSGIGDSAEINLFKK